MSPRGTVHRLGQLGARSRIAAENRRLGETLTDNRSRIYLIERIRVLTPEGKDILPPRKSTQAVLVSLCFARGQRVSRLHLGQRIWDTTTEGQARDNLRHAL